jgi:hypothetical protein
MAKGKRANKLMNRLVLKSTGNIYLNVTDPLLPYFSQEVEKRIQYSDRTILRNFRARSIKLREAAKTVVLEGLSLALVATTQNISQHDLLQATHQFAGE